VNTPDANYQGCQIDAFRLCIPTVAKWPIPEQQVDCHAGMVYLKTIDTLFADILFWLRLAPLDELSLSKVETPAVRRPVERSMLL
jgi:hypothetical protein